MQMNRRSQYTSILGPNWLLGRQLLPELASLGSGFQGTVLDLACGESPFASCFPDAKRFIRVDRNPASKDVLMGDICSIPLDDGSVDLILILQAITDVPEPWKVLAEARRVLNPTGRLVVLESMCYPEHDLPWDYYRLMPEGLRYWAEREQLRVERIRYLGGFTTRVASGWTKVCLGRLTYYKFTRPIGLLLTLFGNVLLYLLSKLERDGPRASDYLAVLTVHDDTPVVVADPYLKNAQ